MSRRRGDRPVPRPSPVFDLVFRHRTAASERRDDPGRSEQEDEGRQLLDRRLGISGAVVAIIAVSAACVAVFVAVLYATSLAF